MSEEHNNTAPHSPFITHASPKVRVSPPTSPHHYPSPSAVPKSPIHRPGDANDAFQLRAHRDSITDHNTIAQLLVQSPAHFASPKQVGVSAKPEPPALDLAQQKKGGDVEKPPQSPKHGHDVLDDAHPDFVISEGLTAEEAEKRLEEFGPNQLPEKIIPKWYLFCSQLWQPMPIMIWIAAAIELGIENWPDAAILLAIQFSNAGLAFYETNKAGNAVAALKAAMKPEATVKRDGVWIKIDASNCVPGDLCLLNAGSAVPADCRINKGRVEVDQAALTGESLPVTLYEGGSAKMGSTVVRGETEGTIEFTGIQTFFGKTASLLQTSNELSNMQKVLIKIMVVLVVLSLVLSGIVFAYLLVNHESVKDALSFTVVLLVASIPIAIEIVVTTTLALGSKELSKHGAIVTRLTAIEDVAGMNILCSDKTGTLTMNKMMIQEDTPAYAAGETQFTMLRYAAMAAKWKEPPKDALDTMVLSQADLTSLSNIKQLDFMPFDPVHKRTEGTIQETLSGGNVINYKTTKGAPHVIAHLCDQDPAIVDQCEKDVHNMGERGIRALAVAKTDENGVWRMLGLLSFLDPPRPDTKATIEQAIKFGIQVKMVTGDHALIAKEMARRLNMGTNIESSKDLPLLDANGEKPKDLGKRYGPDILSRDGFAQVFPEHKYLIVEALREMGFKVGMTGDGVNDAPALKRADVGVAVQGATDAARAAADIVLTQPGLHTIIHAIVIARSIFKRAKSFITYRIAATLQLLVFFFIAVLSMHPNEFLPNPKPADWDDGSEWPRFFHLPVLMLMLITLLNDGTLITVGYDNVKPSKSPERWNLPAVFFISSVLAVVAVLSSLLLLWGGLDSWNKENPFYGMGIRKLHFSQISSMMYLKISISDFLSLFSSRSHGNFFWSSKPCNLLLGGAFVSLGISTIVANVWANSKPDGVPTIGLARTNPRYLSAFVWIYCLVWWLVQDVLKVLSYKFIKTFNIFNIRQAELEEARAQATSNGVTLTVAKDTKSTRAKVSPGTDETVL
eukprot:c11757_g1_i2.p1 GENE.c11757_g1_i2~~c11757_g1_i2.p1  ORF type:complete len:1017 (+),score=217.80 c11757_g1_i2:176-3226(+)